MTSHLRDARNRLDRVSCGSDPNVVIVPRGIGDELLNSLMCGVDPVNLNAVAYRDRLHILTCSLTDQAKRIPSEIGLSLWCAEYVTDHVQVTFEPLLGGVIDVDIHECEVIASAGSPVIACASRYRGKRGRWPGSVGEHFPQAQA
jgi:hypothetical protein